MPSSEVRIDIRIEHEPPYTRLNRTGELHFSLVPSGTAIGKSRVKYEYRYPMKELGARVGTKILKDVDIKIGTYDHDTKSGFFKVREVDEAMGTFMMAHVTEAIATSRAALDILRRVEQHDAINTTRVSETVTVNGTVFVNGQTISWPAMESCSEKTAAHMMKLVAMSWAASMGLRTDPPWSPTLTIPSTVDCRERRRDTRASAHRAAAKSQRLRLST